MCCRYVPCVHRCHRKDELLPAVSNLCAANIDFSRALIWQREDHFFAVKDQFAFLRNLFPRLSEFRARSESWSVIGQDRSRDLNAGLWLVIKLALTPDLLTANTGREFWMLTITFTFYPQLQRSASFLEERGSKFSLNFPNLNEQPTHEFVLLPPKLFDMKWKLYLPGRRADLILNEFYFAIMRYIYRQVNGRKHEAGIKCIIISPIVIANRYKIDPKIFQIHIVNIERYGKSTFQWTHHRIIIPVARPVDLSCGF